MSKLSEQPSAIESQHDSFIRDAMVRQSDNTQVTARRLATKTLVRNSSEPQILSSSLPDAFRASPAELSVGSDSFPVNFPAIDSTRSQTPSEHSMDTDRVSESLTFDSARSHTDSPAFASRSEPFPQDFDPFGDEQPKDPFACDSPEEEVFQTKAIVADPDPFAEDPFVNDPFAGESFESRPKSGSSLGNHSNADTSSQYSDCRSTHESHSHSTPSDSQAEFTATLPKEALSHWESFSEKPTPTDSNQTIVDQLQARGEIDSVAQSNKEVNSNGITGGIKKDPFGSLDPLSSLDFKSKHGIKEDLSWAFKNKNTTEEPADWESSESASNQNQDDSKLNQDDSKLNDNQSTAGITSDHVTSAVNQLELRTDTGSSWATDDGFSVSSSVQPQLTVNGSNLQAQQPMSMQQTAMTNQMAGIQATPPMMPPRPQPSVGNPFAPNNQVRLKHISV